MRRKNKNWEKVKEKKPGKAENKIKSEKDNQVENYGSEERDSRDLFPSRKVFKQSIIRRRERERERGKNPEKKRKTFDRVSFL